MISSARREAWLSCFMLGAPWLFLFLQALPHTAALRSLDLVWLLAAGVWIAVRGQLWQQLRSPLVLALLLLVLVALLSAVAGPYPADSLDAVRKEFLAPTLAFLILVCRADVRRGLVVVTSAIIAGFTLRTLLVLSEWSMLHLPQRLDSVWVKGYAMDAVLFLPLLLASLLLLVRHRGLQLLLVLTLLLEFVIVIEYGSRTALAAVVLAGLLIPLLLGYWRCGFLLMLAAAGIVTIAFWFSPAMKSQYEAALHTESYSGTQGMSGRFPIWHGVTQLIAARPLLGYGPGWKKLAVVAREGGHLVRWKAGGEMDQATATYFDNSPGTVNPHNLMLQVLFEVGALGLAAALLVWGLVGWAIVQAWRRRRDAPIHTWLAVGGAAFLAAYGLMSFSNGLWPLPGPVAGVFAVAELSRRARQMASD